jgi:hypothetical protein
MSAFGELRTKLTGNSYYLIPNGQNAPSVIARVFERRMCVGRCMRNDRLCSGIQQSMFGQ